MLMLTDTPKSFKLAKLQARVVKVRTIRSSVYVDEVVGVLGSLGILE